jgi:hypothetical protein
MPGPAPKQWTRETKWRQGHVLPPAAVGHFGFSSAVDAAATCVVVISHDCDLANDNLEVEPDVEVIVGRFIGNADGNFSWGKAPRKLHYPGARSGAPITFELVSTSKRSVPKVELAQFDADPAFVVGGNGLAVLRSWLGSRYNRAAFPDAFVNRMKELKADHKLAKVIDKHGELISFVYFELDGGENVERAEGDPYQLSIVLVYHPGNDAAEAGEAADELADRVDEAVRGRADGHEDQLIFKSCFAISEDDLPVSRARLLMQWRLEYMTLKADDEQPGPPIL